jgi:hypothetical protein
MAAIYDKIQRFWAFKDSKVNSRQLQVNQNITILIRGSQEDTLVINLKRGIL